MSERRAAEEPTASRPKPSPRRGAARLARRMPRRDWRCHVTAGPRRGVKRLLLLLLLTPAACARWLAVSVAEGAVRVALDRA